MGGWEMRLVVLRGLGIVVIFERHILEALCETDVEKSADR